VTAFDGMRRLAGLGRHRPVRQLIVHDFSDAAGNLGTETRSTARHGI
jgi:hypothetical protein